MRTKLFALMAVTVAVVGFYWLSQLWPAGRPIQPETGVAEMAPPVWTLVSQAELPITTGSVACNETIVSLAEANSIAESGLILAPEKFFIAGILTGGQIELFDSPAMKAEIEQIIFTKSPHLTPNGDLVIN
jgi:hypothetical protein